MSQLLLAVETESEAPTIFCLMRLRWRFGDAKAKAYFSGQTELFDGINPKPKLTQKVANNEQRRLPKQFEPG